MNLLFLKTTQVSIVAIRSGAGSTFKSGNGDAGGNLPWSSESDARSKKDIEPISDALHKVLSLQGVNFTWKEDEMGVQG